MVSPYLTIDALDAQNSSGRNAAHIGNTMNSRLGSCGMTGQGRKFVHLLNLTHAEATKQNKF